MHQHNYQQLLRLPEVLRRTGMSRAWLYKAVGEGGFPPFHKIGRATVWNSASIDAWIADRTSDVASTKAA